MWHADTGGDGDEVEGPRACATTDSSRYLMMMRFMKISVLSVILLENTRNQESVCAKGGVDIYAVSPIP
jgi:hypothetical protein